MKYDVFMGIDPGVKGAIAILGLNDKPIVKDFQPGVVDDELFTSATFKKPIALIERVHALPKQGVSSMFTFGTNYGTWLGRLEALCIPYALINPSVWQRVMFKGTPIRYMMRKGKKVKDTKQISLETARRLFPELVGDKLKLKKYADRADALLLAVYASREFSGRKGR